MEYSLRKVAKCAYNVWMERDDVSILMGIEGIDNIQKLTDNGLYEVTINGDDPDTVLEDLEIELGDA